MPSFPDTAVLVLLALLLFGPKKLPVLARQIGKLMADFRRASNEFRTQMEEELRISEQTDRQKQVAAIEAAAPPTPALSAPTESSPETEDPHVPPPAPSLTSTSESESSESDSGYPQDYSYDSPDDSPADSPAESTPEPSPVPLPIATSGDLSILPPATGLPIANSSPAEADLTDAPLQPHQAELETETLHG
jgi:sec-independent protein translocase protein TatB